MKKPSHMARAAAAQKQRLVRIAANERARQEAREVADGVAETTALSAARGTVIEQPKATLGRNPPMRRVTGLEWLATRKPARINEAQRAMGEKWGAYWRMATGEQSLKSCIAEPNGAGGDPLWFALSAAELRIAAGDRLADLNEILLGQATLIGALTDVCGKEMTPREAARNGAEALRVECLVCVALDMLVEGSGRQVYGWA